MATVISDWAPLYVAVLSIVLGGGISGAVHVTKAKLRLVSTGVTAGIGNPLISVTEDVGALVGSLGALALPFVAAALILGGAVAGWLALRALRRRPTQSLS